MGLARRHQATAWQRTAPYLGVACLALLALTSARGLASGYGSGADGRALAPSNFSWLATPATAPTFAGLSGHLNPHGALISRVQAGFALAGVVTAELASAVALLVLAGTTQRLVPVAPALLLARSLALDH